MTRVCFLIDGMNVFHALKDSFNDVSEKIDPQRLSTSFLKKSETLSQVHYFTANPIQKAPPLERYISRLKSVRSVSFFLHFSEFRNRKRKCTECKQVFTIVEEKETDVNIAVKLLDLAINDKFDTAFIVSGDSDLVSAIKTVKNNFPEKKVGVVIPYGRKAKILKQYADFAMKMKAIHVETSQFEVFETLLSKGKQKKVLEIAKMNFPKRYVERIHEMLPESEWEAFFQNVTKPLPKTVRLRMKKGNIPSGWDLKPVACIPNAYFIQRKDQMEVPLGKTLEHFSGGIYVASLSSLLPPLILNPDEEDRVLDMCAAPGSKAVFMSDLMENKGLLILNELSSSRSKKLVSNIERMGVLNSVLLQSDGTRMNSYFDQQFTRILLDAPCSSEGFARKDSRYFDKMWSEKKIFEAAKLQKKLIISAFEILAPGGEMVYSTCTSAPEENEAVVQHLLNKYPDEVEILPISFSVPFNKVDSSEYRVKEKKKEQGVLGTNVPSSLPSRPGIQKFFHENYDPQIAQNSIRIWPHLETDAWSSESFFITKIRKKCPSYLSSPLSKGGLRGVIQHKQQRSTNITILTQNQATEITTYLRKNWGWEKDLFKEYVWIEKKNSIWIASKESARFALKHPYRRFGFPVLDEHRNLTSVFAIQFGMYASNNFLVLDISQKEKWLRGEDLYFDQPLGQKEGSMILVRFEHYCLGFGKIQDKGKKLKNKLDRDLVMY